MQCKEWDDANSELFKEFHDEAVHKNSYKSRLYELISASLVHPMAPQGATRDCGGENEESLAVITIPADPPLVASPPPFPYSRGHYGCWALCYMILLPPRAAIHNPQRPKAAVKPKNPPARKGRSILRTFLYNPFAQPAAKPRPFAPQGRVLLHSGPRRALCTILPAYHSIQAGYYSLLLYRFFY